MRTVSVYFLKRIPREGYKGLAVPFLALVMVFLINIVGGVRQQQTADLEEVIDLLEIRAEISDPVSGFTENLRIEKTMIEIFTNPSSRGSLAEFFRDIWLKRTFIPENSGYTLSGLTYFAIESDLSPQKGVTIEYYGEYSEEDLQTDKFICFVPETMPLDEIPFGLTVAGIIRGGPQDIIYLPFWTVNEIAVSNTETAFAYSITGNTVNFISASENQTVYSELLYAYVKDNRRLEDIKRVARVNFTPMNQAYSTFNRPALTLFDSNYHDTTEKLKKNIFLIDVSMPFIFAITVCIGFLVSYLITRRRKPEFAVMRGIGFSKIDIFSGALFEQILLCAIGTFFGCLLYIPVFGYLPGYMAVVFIGCYALGATVSAVNAAGTNVLKILRDRE